MIFKDQAHQLVARWECLRDEDEIETIAAQTAISLSASEDVPDSVLRALDDLMDLEYEKRGRRLYEVVRYLRSLTVDIHRIEDKKGC